MKTILNLFLTIFVVLNAQNSIISGFISDSSSGEALIGANIFLQETGQGMATDINGYYIIQDIVPGNYTIMVSYVGYDMFKKQISLSSDESKKIDISLIEQVVELSEVEVTAEKLQRRNNIQPSKINLSPRMMKAAWASIAASLILAALIKHNASACGFAAERTVAKLGLIARQTSHA